MSGSLSYRNFIDAAATVLTAPSGQTIDSDHPIANLKKRGLGEYFAITNPSGLGLIVQIDFGSSRTFNFVAALGTNWDANGGSMDLTLRTSADGVSFTTVSTTTVTDVAPVGLPAGAATVIPAGLSTRYLRVVLSWSGGDTERMARLWIDNALLLDRKVQADARFGAVDAGSLNKTDGQQYVEFERPRTKQSEFTFRGLSTLEAWGFEETSDTAADVPSFNSCQFAAGSTGEVIVLPKITNTAARELWIRRTGVYGHLENPLTIEQDGNSTTWTASLRLQEER